MKTLRRMSAIAAVLLISLFVLAPVRSHAQNTVSKRRIVEQMVPIYPELARNIALEGTVKLDALVAPDGSVKNIVVKGGPPVLVEAAISAVRRWRWETAAHESHELVEVRFSPK